MIDITLNEPELVDLIDCLEVCSDNPEDNASDMRRRLARQFRRQLELSKATLLAGAEADLAADDPDPLVAEYLTSLSPAQLAVVKECAESGCTECKALLVTPEPERSEGTLDTFVGPCDPECFGWFIEDPVRENADVRSYDDDPFWYVHRCDECGLYASDEDAAFAHFDSVLLIYNGAEACPSYDVIARGAKTENAKTHVRDWKEVCRNVAEEVKS